MLEKLQEKLHKEGQYANIIVGERLLRKAESPEYVSTIVKERVVRIVRV
jgi:hypothetical protein